MGKCIFNLEAAEIQNLAKNDEQEKFDVFNGGIRKKQEVARWPEVAILAMGQMADRNF